MLQIIAQIEEVLFDFHAVKIVIWFKFSWYFLPIAGIRVN